MLISTRPSARSGRRARSNLIASHHVLKLGTFQRAAVFLSRCRQLAENAGLLVEIELPPWRKLPAPHDVEIGPQRGRIGCGGSAQLAGRLEQGHVVERIWHR